MALSIIGAGFGRTGTLSLKGALEQLGFGPCYHMIEVVKNPSLAAHWQAIGEGKPADWEEMFEGYHATVDWPGCAYYAELAARYPLAKVILSVRDANAWFDSASSTIFKLMPRQMKPGRYHIGHDLVLQKTFGGNLDDRDHAVAVYERHNAEVIRTIPADRLLVYDLAEGWGPLCEFLNVPVPATPMPKVNTTEDFARTWNKTPRR
ncbi:MAG: sulfotransferase family protein [Alphaproteobacteria bacterium]|nr:sulfotransferase family protein [Alphaproteobacteria bacterium]